MCMTGGTRAPCPACGPALVLQHMHTPRPVQLVWGVDLLTGFSTFSATVLALTFVFGNSIK